MRRITDIQKIGNKFSNIYEKTEKDKSVKEDKVKRYFHKSEILEHLGFKEEDIKVEETIKEGKQTDVHCVDEYGNVVLVVEFKRPSVTNLEEHRPQLWKRYMKPLKADYGILYNGLDLIFYERIGDDYNEIFRTETEEISEERLKKLVQYLEKPEYETTDIDKVSKYFSKFDREEEMLSLKEEASREHFFQNFQLKENSEFGKLLANTIQLFEELKGKNTFLDSAYDFWKQSYAKKPESVPDDWKPLMEKAGISQKKEDLYKFMFCLETTYAIFARLILAKSGEDYGFPDIEFRQFIENEIKRASYRGDISQAAYAKITRELIRNMKRKLVSSVFEEDIFYWWTEPFKDKTYDELFGKGRETTLEMGKFGQSLAKMLLMIYKYDFSQIEGDPLGVLYQKYFDKETRKALGEFYTPQEVVDYILDSTEYEGKKILDKRLLDPACGSGTFIVTALQRYLKASEEKAEKEGWDNVLDDICNKYRIVGFDIHPFATIMAQIQFMLVLLPYYQKAVKDSKEKGDYFTLQRVPIFRTDSLVDESKGEDSKMTLKDYQEGSKIVMDIKLPVTDAEEGSFFETEFEMPHKKTVLKQDQVDIYNNEEYFATLQALFDTVKKQAEKMQRRDEKQEFNKQEFQKALKERYLTGKNFEAIADFFESFANDLLEKINRLQTEFDDGRLIKSIEDVFLAALLKNEQKYDFVVGNPPYVRRRIFEGEKDPYSEWFSAYGSYDIFIPFSERSIRWLTEGGKLGCITSNKYFVKDYGKKIRPFILQNTKINQLLDLSFAPNVFENPQVYGAITILERIEEEIKTKEEPEKCPENRVQINLLMEDKKEALKEPEKYEYISEEVKQERFLNNENYVFDLFAVGYDDQIEKMRANGEKLSSKYTISGGFMGFEYREAEENIYTKPGEGRKKILTPSFIEPHNILWGKKKVRVFNDSFKKLYIEKYPELRNSLWGFFDSQKLIVRGIAKQTSAVYDKEGHGLLVNVFGVYNEKANEDEYLFLEGVINSEPVNFYHLINYYLGRIPEGSLDYPKPFWENLPIPNYSDEVVSKVTKIKNRLKLEEKTSDIQESYLSDSVEVIYKKLQCNASHSSISPSVKDTQDGIYKIVIGKRKKEEPILVDTKEKARFVKVALEDRSVKKDEKIEFPVPKSNKVVKEILKEYEEDKKKLEEMPSVEELEEEINEIVYDLYGLDDEDIEVIEDFLEKF